MATASESVTVRTLALIGRTESEQLRIDVDVHQGYQFLNVRVWTCLDDGHWVPTANGLSIHIFEAPAVADALRAAIELFTRAEDVR